MAGISFRRIGVAAGVGAGLLLIAPAIGQPADGPAPRSLLPKGFGPPPEPVAPPAPLPGVVPDPVDEDETAEALEDNGPPPLAGVDLPTGPGVLRDALAAREVAVGVLGPTQGGWGEAAFSGADGRFLAALARRVQTPIASRWVAIALRRAFLSKAEGPVRLSQGDWVATRAHLLTRLGDIDAAKLLVDRLPVDAYSPATYRVAGQVAMAAADLGALCPIARTGRELSRDPLWELALGMCAALEGDDISAAAIFDRLQQQRGLVSPFDVRLGERVVTMAGGGGRVSGVDWTEAPALTPYRYGVALASGMGVPADRLEGLGSPRFGWLVRQPALPPEVRLAALPVAAVQGNLSSRELVSGVALLDADEGADSLATRLRTAFAGAGTSARVAAMQAIWAMPQPGLDAASARYAGLIATAPAVLRLPVDKAAADASADLIASLLAAGEIQAARRWWPVAQGASGAVRARAWALLAVTGGMTVTPETFQDWRKASGADARAAARLLAALDGLGMMREGDWAGPREALASNAESGWARAIAAAGDKRHSGAVIMLAATGLQGAMADVPAQHVQAITRALVASGRMVEARLFAAEVLSRT
jgi:hypothetical protein